MAIEHKYVQVQEVNLHYVQSGTNNAQGTIVFLHGFPESWQTWHEQIQFFSERYQVIAPDLPGYNLSDKPESVAFFTVPNLIKFIADFIKTVAPDEQIYLVAHDWGGAIAWPLTAFYPEIVNKLVILNAAHPSTFTREMINNPEQRKKSEYIHDLISENAENKLLENECEYLFDKVLSTMEKSTLTEQKRQEYLTLWRQPGAVNGMLQYYRAMPQLASRSSEENISNVSDRAHVEIIDTQQMKIPSIRIAVPTLILWGEQDQAFVKENLVGLGAYIPDCQIQRFAQASHWLQHELPDQVNEAIALFIGNSNKS